jgi:hypothetical protein
MLGLISSTRPYCRTATTESAHLLVITGHFPNTVPLLDAVKAGRMFPDSKCQGTLLTFQGSAYRARSCCNRRYGVSTGSTRLHSNPATAGSGDLTGRSSMLADFRRTEEDR